jgi:hypothetical protein
MIAHKDAGLRHFTRSGFKDNPWKDPGAYYNAIRPDPLQAKSSIEPAGLDREPEKGVQDQKGDGKNQEEPGFPNGGKYALNNFQGAKDTK